MESQKVDLFIMTNSKFFESHHLQAIRDRLLELDGENLDEFTAVAVGMGENGSTSQSH